MESLGWSGSQSGLEERRANPGGTFLGLKCRIQGWLKSQKRKSSSQQSRSSSSKSGAPQKQLAGSRWRRHKKQCKTQKSMCPPKPKGLTSRLHRLGTSPPWSLHRIPFDLPTTSVRPQGIPTAPLPLPNAQNAPGVLPEIAGDVLLLL